MEKKLKYLIGLFVAILNVLLAIFIPLCFVFYKKYLFWLVLLCIVLFVFEVAIYKKKIIQEKLFWYGYFTISVLYFFAYVFFLLYSINNTEITVSLKLVPFAYGYPALLLIPLFFFFKMKKNNLVLKVIAISFFALVYLLFPGILMT